MRNLVGTRNNKPIVATHYIEALASTRYLILVDRRSGAFQSTNWEDVMAVGPDTEEGNA